jgi:hypothetical protein
MAELMVKNLVLQTFVASDVATGKRMGFHPAMGQGPSMSPFSCFPRSNRETDVQPGADIGAWRRAGRLDGLAGAPYRCRLAISARQTILSRWSPDVLGRAKSNRVTVSLAKLSLAG